MSDIPKITNTFSVGDKVTVKYDAALGECEVVNSCDPTTAYCVHSNKPVGHYIRVKINTGAILGYHEESLTLI